MKRDFVKIAYFSDERKAALFQARLEESNIPSFVSNAHANSLLPHIGGGVGIHIHKEHLELGQEIFIKFKEMEDTDQSVFTHHEATHEDIEYEKALNRGSKFNIASKIALALLILVLLRYFAKSRGLLPQYFEPF